MLNSHEVPLPDGVRRLHGDRQRPGVLREVLADRRDDFDVVFDNTAYHVEDLDPSSSCSPAASEQLSSPARRRCTGAATSNRSWRRSAPTIPSTTTPARPMASARCSCEQYLLGQWERTGLPTTSLRVVHTLGPRSPLASRDPVFFARLEQGRPIFVPGEGFAAVHLVHVADVARLMASVVANPLAAGQIYNVAGAEVTSIIGAVRLMARAVGVEANVVPVPMDIARRRTPPLVHWGEALTGGMMFSIDKALHDLDWTPEFGVEAGYRDSYEWFASGGRDRYEFDFSGDDELLASLG